MASVSLSFFGLVFGRKLKPFFWPWLGIGIRHFFDNCELLRARLWWPFLLARLGEGPYAEQGVAGIIYNWVYMAALCEHLCARSMVWFLCTRDMPILCGCGPKPGHLHWHARSRNLVRRWLRRLGYCGGTSREPVREYAFAPLGG